jgi:hypothetical protein
MSYYHEARAQVRKLKEIQESNQRRSERRAEVAGANVSGARGRAATCRPPPAAPRRLEGAPSLRTAARAPHRARPPPPQAEHPMNFLTIEGRTCKTYKNADQHASTEAMEGLIPWNGQQDNLIDRFDGRALLDFYREPDARLKNRPKTSDELKLEEVRRWARRGAAAALRRRCGGGLAALARPPNTLAGRAGSPQPPDGPDNAAAPPPPPAVPEI